MVKNDRLNFFEIILNKFTSIIIKIITTIKDTAHWYFTLAAIPKVISAKYMTNSSALLTGFLNLTIDIAPIIPKEREIFPLIVLVIINVTNGKTKKGNHKNQHQISHKHIFTPRDDFL